MNRKVLDVLEINSYYILTEEEWSLGMGDAPTPMKAAYSVVDGTYIGREEEAQRLAKMGIVAQATSPGASVATIGFCEREQKWYGWSHRAIYGFGVGSEVKKGDCAYVPSTSQELYDEHISLYKPECIDIVSDGIKIEHKMVRYTFEDPDTGELSGAVDDESDYQFVETGRGEWTAETLEDAKQMAIDFSSGVS